MDGKAAKNILTKVKDKLYGFNGFLTCHKLFSAAVFSMFFSSTCLFKSPYYHVDNALISMVVNQRFGTDNYCIFLNYILCKMVLLVNKAFPYADGYVFICHILLYVSMFWIAYIVFSNTNDFRKRIILLMTAIIVWLGFDKCDLSNSNFTMQAGGLAAVGAISVFAGMHSKKVLPHLFMAILFLTFASMIRISACLLVLPYIVLHVLIDIICSKDKSVIKRACVVMLIPFMFVVGVYAINIGVNSSEKYEAGYEFNHARSQLVDYPKKEWEEVRAELDDITQNDYMGIYLHLYGDTQRHNTEYFKKISNIANLPKGTELIGHCMYMLEIFLKINLLVLMLITLFSIIVILKYTGIWRKIETILAIIGSAMIVVFICYNLRIALRAIIPAILGYVSLICTIFLYDVNKPSKVKELDFRFMSLFCMVTALVFFVNAWRADVCFSPALYAKTGADESKFEKYYGEDNLYVWDTFTLDGVAYPYFYKQGKLQTERFLLHNVPQGEWIYGQKYMQEYFEKINTNNPVRALVERKNTYYVAANKDIMETYLKEHVNPDIQAEKADEFDGVPIWKFDVKK